MNNLNDDSSGRRRAALRVKQRRRQDEKTWSPSGKLLVKSNRNRRTSSSRRPSSSSNRRPSSSSRPSHERPWNERFIYEDETVLEHATDANQKRLGSANSRQSVDGKENNANDATTAKPQAASGCQSIQYTERADGEAVVEFSRSEILTSPISNMQPDNELIGRKEVSTSPFDLDKVNASLEADAAANDPLHQTPTAISESSLHTPHQTSNEPLINPLFSMPLDKDKVKAVLENCADLLYTIELEEELLRRDIASRDHQNHQSSTNSDCTDTERREERSEQQEYLPIRTEPERIQVPLEKREQIISHIQQSKSTKDQQQQVVTDLQYQEIAELLAEEILDECIADIAEQLYGHDRVA